MVLPENSTMAYDTMMAYGAANLTKVNLHPSYNHGQCWLPAHSNVRAWFDTFRTDCNNIDTGLDIPIGNGYKMTISSNPICDVLQISNFGFQTPDLEIYNVYGQKVHPPAGRAGSTQFPLPIAVGKTQLTINLSDKPNGIYFLSIKTENLSIYQKFIISR